MSGRVWDDAVVEAVWAELNAVGFAAHIKRGRHERERDVVARALDAAADAVEATVRAETLAPIAALIEKWDSRTVMHGDVEIRTVRSTAELAGSAVGLLNDLRAVLGDPDAAAQHNATIWDTAFEAGYDYCRTSQGGRVRDVERPPNPYRTTEGESADTLVHWEGEPGRGPTSLHGNGAASFARTSGDEDEVTCRLCLTLLARDPEWPEGTSDHE